MFLICSLLIGLAVVATAILNRNSTVEQEELIPIPVRTNSIRNLRKFD